MPDGNLQTISICLDLILPLHDGNRRSESALEESCNVGIDFTYATIRFGLVLFEAIKARV